jgi:prephenate dehydratase
VNDDIEDRLGNQTSFALIGRPGITVPLRGERYKTSVALFMREDRAGTLNMILSEFAYAGVNITMIQSRPTKQALGDYMFFLDLEGRVEEPALQTALNCLRLKLREVKVLGSYPVD